MEAERHKDRCGAMMIEEDDPQRIRLRCFHSSMPSASGSMDCRMAVKTAMRVPAVLERYALSILLRGFQRMGEEKRDGRFTESVTFSRGEYEMPEWDLGHTFITPKWPPSLRRVHSWWNAGTMTGWELR